MQRILLVILGLGLSTVASAHTTTICTTDNLDGTTDIHFGTYTLGHDGSFSATLFVDMASYGPYSSWSAGPALYPGADQCVDAGFSRPTSWWVTITVSDDYGPHSVTTADTSNEFDWHSSLLGGGSVTMTFGAKDTDGDGVLDHLDDCPTEDPATYYGYDVGTDGCIVDTIGTGCPLASAIRDDDGDFNNMADEWGILARGNAVLSGASQGTLRVFGDGDLYSFNIGTSPMNALSYGGKGDLYARSGSFSGDVRADNVDVDGTVSIGGSTSSAAFPGHISAYMAALSTDMGNHNINGNTIVHSWGTVAFSGSHPMMNTFEVTAADFTASTYMTIDVPSGSSAVVNVLGTSAEFGPTGVTLTGVDATDVVYNFPTATSLELDGVSVKGQILAPLADVDIVTGDITGTITSDDLDGTVTQYNASFDARACAVVAAKAVPLCTMTHTVTSSWPGGFNANVTITNSGSAASSWDAAWSLGTAGSYSSGWGGVYTSTTSGVAVENASWNGGLGAGSSVTIGYSGSGSASGVSGMTASCD